MACLTLAHKLLEEPVADKVSEQVWLSLNYVTNEKLLLIGHCNELVTLLLLRD